MNSTNYVIIVVKILEISKPNYLTNEVFVAHFKVQLSDLGIIYLTFWSLVTNDILNYYKINDYIIVEGFLFISNNKLFNLDIEYREKLKIAISKIYPYFLNFKFNFPLIK